MWHAARLGVAAGLTAAVSGALVAQTPHLHPDPRLLDATIPPTFQIAVEATSATTSLRLSSDVRASFGSAEEPNGDLLGHIEGMLLLPSGRIAVLDDRMSRLRLFDRTGVPQQSLGREGRGPGEFTSVFALAADGSSRLYISDATRTIHVFAMGQTGYGFERSIRLDVGAHSMCFLRGRLVVQGGVPGREQLIHIFDVASGRRIRAFGALYRSSNLGLNTIIAMGKLACDEDNGIVFYSPRTAIGEVRAYRLDGRLVWRVSLTGYRVSRIQDAPRGGYSVSGTPAGVHSVLAMTLVPGHGLLLQVAYRSPRALNEGTPFTTLYSLLLDPVSGRPAHLGTALPPIVAARGNEVGIALEDPVPRFEVRAVR